MQTLSMLSRLRLLVVSTALVGVIPGCDTSDDISDREGQAEAEANDCDKDGKPRPPPPCDENGDPLPPPHCGDGDGEQKPPPPQCDEDGERGQTGADWHRGIIFANCRGTAGRSARRPVVRESSR